MKVVISIIVTGVIAFFAESFGPWWIGIAVAFLVAAIAQLKLGQAFLMGFLAIGIMWGVSAGIIDNANNSVLSARIGQLFGGLSPTLMIAVTALLGALVGGISAYSGAAGMRWMIGQPR